MSSSTDAVRSPAASRHAHTPEGAFATTRRWVAAHQHITAAIACAIFVLLYLWPVLFGGKILGPTSALYQFSPWTSTAPADIGDYYNPLLTDIPMAHYPWNTLARDFVRSGTFPGWSQHAFAGTPFFANLQTVLLSPFSIPLWLLPLNYALGLVAALKLWVASFGMYLLVRELRLSFWPGLLAGVSYALCAFNLVWLTHETLPAVAALLPWTVLLVERTIRTGNPAAALWLAPATAVMVSGGHPGTAVHAALATGIYALVRAGIAGQLTFDQRLRRLGLALGGIALGGLLIAVLVIPTMRAGGGTIGEEARTGGEGTMPGVTMPLEAIRSTIFPDWWGRPSNGQAPGPANYNERTFYGGGVAALLALVALLAPTAWRRKAAFLLIGVLGLAIPLHAPVLHSLASSLPVIETVQNQRMLLFGFAVPVLGAFGLQRLLDLRRPDWRAWTAIGIGAVLAALGAVSASGADLGDAISNSFSGITHVEPKTLILTSVTWWSVLLVGVVLATLALWRWPRRGMAIAGLVVVLAVVDMLHFAGDYQPMGPASKSIPPRTGTVDFLAAHRDDGRFVGLGYAMTENWSAIYGLRDVRGYDPPQPSLAYYHLWQVLSPQQANWTPFDLGGFEEAGLNVLSVLGARYIAGPPGMEPEARSPLSVGYSGSDGSVLVNPDAVPRAMVPERVELATDVDSVPGLVGEVSFRPRRDVVIERGEPGAAEELAASQGPNGTARIVGETNSTVSMEASLRRRGLVVLNDSLAPGWTVTVDGKSRPVIAANSVMRGVVVDAGTHDIKWSYRVPGLRLGAALTLVGLVVLAGAMALLLRQRRRQRPAT